MKGRDIRCPHCGATALRSVAADFELENQKEDENRGIPATYNSFFFLRCDGTPRHNFTFSANEQRAMTREQGARAQDKLYEAKA